MNEQTIVKWLKQKRKSQKRLRVTYGDSSSSLQSELVGKLVDDGAGITYLSLHLPVAQRLVLQERKKGREMEDRKC